MSEGDQSQLQKAREELSELMTEACPVAAVIKDRGRGVCPNYGPSGTCADCMYPWIEIASRSIDVAKKHLKVIREKKQEKKHVSMRETRELILQIDMETKAEMTELEAELQEIARSAQRMRNKMAGSVSKLSSMFDPFREVPDAPPPEDVVASDDHG